MTAPRATTLCEALGMAVTAVHSQHPDMAVLGPKTWASLHQWARSFKEEVGDSCGCGEFAVRLASFAHDIVNSQLGRPLYDRENVQKFREMVDLIDVTGVHQGQKPRLGVVMYAPPPFGWPGGKRRLAKHIIALMPSHKVYVEPFVGAGAVFWAKPRSQVEILSDVNPDLIRFYQNIATMEACDVVGLARDWDGIRARDGRLTPCEFLAEVNCSYFNKTNGGFNPQRCKNGGTFHNHIGEYRQRIEGVQILKSDWESVVRQYDSPDTFFYFDTPYTSGWKDYPAGGNADQLTRLKVVLPTLKGKWLLSYDDTPEVRASFPGKVFLGILEHRSLGNLQTHPMAKAVLIANYPLPKFKAAQDAAMAEGVGVYPFDPAEYDEDEEEENPDGPTIRHRKPKTKFRPKIKKRREPVTSQQVSMGVATMEPRDKRPPKAWWDSCIRGVEGDDHAAVCGRIWTRISPKVKARIRRQGEVFNAAQMSLEPLTLSNSFLSMVLGTASQAVIATVASTLVARALGGAIAVTGSPQAGIKVIDDRPSRCKDTEYWDGELCKSKELQVTGSPGVVSPAHVQGDQAQVDVGTLLEEIDAILRDPSKMGKVNVDTLKVVRG